MNLPSKEGSPFSAHGFRRSEDHRQIHRLGYLVQRPMNLPSKEGSPFSAHQTYFAGIFEFKEISRYLFAKVKRMRGHPNNDHRRGIEYIFHKFLRFVWTDPKHRSAPTRRRLESRTGILLVLLWFSTL